MFEHAARASLGRRSDNRRRSEQSAKFHRFCVSVRGFRNFGPFSGSVSIFLNGHDSKEHSECQHQQADKVVRRDAEFHVVFQNPYSADFFDSAWRRFRKRGAYPTAITQNVEYLLDSVQASTMLSNSEMLILLNQAPSDREKLAALLNISPEQTGYITNAPAGSGLLRYGGALVPFKNQFPKDTELYRLMTTKPDESIIVGSNTK